MQGIGLFLSPYYHNSVRNERKMRAERKVNAQLNGGATNRVVNLGGCDDTHVWWPYTVMPHSVALRLRFTTTINQ